MQGDVRLFGHRCRVNGTHLRGVVVVVKVGGGGGRVVFLQLQPQTPGLCENARNFHRPGILCAAVVQTFVQMPSHRQVGRGIRQTRIRFRQQFVHGP